MNYFALIIRKQSVVENLIYFLTINNKAQSSRRWGRCVLQLKVTTLIRPVKLNLFLFHTYLHMKPNIYILLLSFIFINKHYAIQQANKQKALFFDADNHTELHLQCCLGALAKKWYQLINVLSHTEQVLSQGG